MNRALQTKPVPVGQHLTFTHSHNARPCTHTMTSHTRTPHISTPILTSTRTHTYTHIHTYTHMYTHTHTHTHDSPVPPGGAVALQTAGPVRRREVDGLLGGGRDPAARGGPRPAGRVVAHGQHLDAVVMVIGGTHCGLGRILSGREGRVWGGWVWGVGGRWWRFQMGGGGHVGSRGGDEDLKWRLVSFRHLAVG